ncbi:hypothetical protein [Pseudoalteromonas piscicida]|uniref:hypothetical protein n=1 Tax=Pseudoalteromonas piscicida TaxID=43662 RepID=UPI0005FA55AE|nr:hypothetical protein [Pseudoalteromonas piscicida]KJY96738.1 hypothetical protein TW73_16005 [Pseudoalteromonas piscicida]
MKNKILFASLCAVLSSSVMASGAGFPIEIDPRPCPTSFGTAEPVTPAPFYTHQDMLDVAANITPHGVYIGGQRYSFDIQYFAPVYGVYYDRIFNQEMHYISSYKAQFIVDGDFGQLLNFDISGSLSEAANITVSCGDFRASAYGTRSIQVNKQQRTGGSCDIMTITVAADKARCPRLGVPPASAEMDSMNFTVIISENLD